MVALVAHDRGACNHAKPLGIEPPDLDNHLLRQSVTEVILAGVARQVLERQHGQHQSPLSLWLRPRAGRHEPDPGNDHSAENRRCPHQPASPSRSAGR